jgi:hypothetical protein
MLANFEETNLLDEGDIGKAVVLVFKEGNKKGRRAWSGRLQAIILEAGKAGSEATIVLEGDRMHCRSDELSRIEVEVYRR